MSKSFYNKFFLIIFSLLLISGCAAPLAVTMSEGGAAPQTSKTDVGYIYVYRESEFMASLRGIYISADGKRIGALNNGTYFIHETKPGNIILTAENTLDAPVTRTLSIQPGKKYFVKGSFKSGFWDVVPNLTIMNESEGESAIQGLKYANIKN
jgi:hypothetical protein